MFRNYFVLLHVISILFSCVSVSLTKKLTETGDFKIMLKGGLIMEMIRNMDGCGTFRDGSI